MGCKTKGVEKMEVQNVKQTASGEWVGVSGGRQITIMIAKPEARRAPGGGFEAVVACNWTHRADRKLYKTKSQAIARAKREILAMREMCARDLCLAAAGKKTRADGTKLPRYQNAGWLLKMYGGNPAEVLGKFLGL
jgi:hypothetical protein